MQLLSADVEKFSGPLYAGFQKEVICQSCKQLVKEKYQELKDYIFEFFSLFGCLVWFLAVRSTLSTAVTGADLA